MNKYKLLHEITKENILSILISSNVSKLKISFIKDELSAYDELVERARPKSKTFEETCIVSGIDYYICNNCHKGSIEDTDEFCRHCGQDLTLDWSDE